MFRATNSELIYYAVDFQLHWANGICYSVKWAFPSEHLVSLDHLTKVWENEVCKHSTAMPAASLFCTKVLIPLTDCGCTCTALCAGGMGISLYWKCRKLPRFLERRLLLVCVELKMYYLPCTNSVDDGLSRSRAELCEMADVNRTVCN